LYYEKIGLVKINNKIYKINEIPDNLTVDGDLDLRYREDLIKLPNNLTISGKLNLTGCISLRKIGDNLKVGKTIHMDDYSTIIPPHLNDKVKIF
jgi:hypothetical protein